MSRVVSTGAGPAQFAVEREAVTMDPREVQYLVLPDATKPYLLARVRWPDVCQAISPGRPLWQDDPGLFDLPYDPNCTPVTLQEATEIAAGWGMRMADHARPSAAYSLVRRMPADWFDLSPAERRAWSLDVAEIRRPTAGVAPADPAESTTSRRRRRRARLAPDTTPPIEAAADGAADTAPEVDLIDLRDSVLQPLGSGTEPADGGGHTIDGVGHTSNGGTGTLHAASQTIDGGTAKIDGGTAKIDGVAPDSGPYGSLPFAPAETPLPAARRSHWKLRTINSSHGNGTARADVSTSDGDLASTENGVGIIDIRDSSPDPAEPVDESAPA